jgi:hypothetical protein
MTVGRRRCSVGDGACREGWGRSRNTALRCQHPANYASAGTYALKVSGFAAAQIGASIHVS